MCNRKVYLHSTELFIHRYFISIFSLTLMYGVCTYSFSDRRVGTARPGLLGRHGVTPCWHADWLHPLHLPNNTLYCFIIVLVDANFVPVVCPLPQIYFHTIISYCCSNLPLCFTMETGSIAVIATSGKINTLPLYIFVTIEKKWTFLVKSF